MKKLISIITCLIMALSSVSVLATTEDQESAEKGFWYEEDGTVIDAEDYFNDLEVEVPGILDETEVLYLADGLFAGASCEYILMNEPLEIIGDGAFEASAVKEVYIPATVTYIGAGAFADCKQLEEIYFMGDESIEFGEGCFADTNNPVFSFSCTIDKDTMYEKLSAAKGDDEYVIGEIHNSVVEGIDTASCADCGFTVNAQGEILYDTPRFTDVPTDSWYYDYVETAVLFSILNGKGEGKFDPDASMTLAEAAKIAACIYNLETGGNEPFLSTGENWYDVYVDYCYKNNIIENNMNFDWGKNATRGEMAYMFARANVDILEINPDVPLTDIPDVYEITRYSKEILDLYRRGIAAGSDEKFTFYPESDVKRSEAAAFIARIIDPEMRIELPRG